MRFDWNRLLEKDTEQQLTGWLFLKLLALIYFAAFFSLSVQINGLAGPDGILPFQELLENAERSMGGSAWLRLPTLFWIDAGDTALLGATILGMLLSALLFLNIRPRLSLLLLFMLYLSLFHAGQIFMSFQWDYLLMETGLLALFVVGGPSRLVIFMFHWLLFRLRFLSGVSKLLSDDPSWSGMTALKYYFETQPLPHAGAWYAHQLPDWMLHAGVGLTFFAELVVPFFIFLPRRFRLFAAAVTILIQLLIVATSNHNFINLLTILLCLFLLDDRIVGRLLPGRIRQRIGQDAHPKTRQGIGVVVVSAVILSASVPGAVGLSLNTRLPEPLQSWMIQVSRFGVGNVYHIFPIRHKERDRLREHLLKNVSAPQQLYQLLHPQLPRQEFPPPRTLSGRSIRHAVGEQGGQMAGLEPQGMGIVLVSATLLPALQGELDPESGALEGNLGVLEDLGAPVLRGFLAAHGKGEDLDFVQMEITLACQGQPDVAGVPAPEVDRLKRILDEIRSGKFADEFITEVRSGGERFEELREAGVQSLETASGAGAPTPAAASGSASCFKFQSIASAAARYRRSSIPRRCATLQPPGRMFSTPRSCLFPVRPKRQG